MITFRCIFQRVQEKYVVTCSLTSNSSNAQARAGLHSSLATRSLSMIASKICSLCLMASIFPCCSCRIPIILRCLGSLMQVSPSMSRWRPSFNCLWESPKASPPSVSKPLLLLQLDVLLKHVEKDGSDPTAACWEMWLLCPLERLPPEDNLLRCFARGVMSHHPMMASMECDVQSGEVHLEIS